MVNQIISILESVFSSCVSWFGSLMGASGLFGFVLSMFLIYGVVKFLLAPVLSERGSDQASKTSKKNDKE